VTTTVRIENTYACGRESWDIAQVADPPAAALDDDARDEYGIHPLDRWYTDVVHDHTGDGHPCGSSEHAVYEATIVEAPPELAALIGRTVGSEG